jgi:rubrerythrin
MKKMSEKASLEAFQGESMAHMKYSIYADVAEKEGYPNVARMFRAISYAEQVHASNHARNLGYVGSTEENLSDAIKGETFEVEEMYPVYMETAELQNESGAKRAFHYAMEAEKIHAKMYSEAKDIVEKGKDTGDENIYICPTCGYTHVGDEPDACPVCGYKGEFKKF